MNDIRALKTADDVYIKQYYECYFWDKQTEQTLQGILVSIGEKDSVVAAYDPVSSRTKVYALQNSEIYHSTLGIKRDIPMKELQKRIVELEDEVADIATSACEMQDAQEAAFKELMTDIAKLKEDLKNAQER